jgi:hypothetical protein
MRKQSYLQGGHESANDIDKKVSYHKTQVPIL